MKSSFCIDLQRFMLIPTKFPLSRVSFKNDKLPHDYASATNIRVYVELPGTTTGIGSVNVDKHNNANNAVYNLQGQRVNGKSLPKGIYIKNGKKFMVK